MLQTASLTSEPSALSLTRATTSPRGGTGTRGDLHDLGNLLQVATSAMNILERLNVRATSTGAGQIISGTKEALQRASVLARRLVNAPGFDGVEEAQVDVGATLKSVVWRAQTLAPAGVTIDHVSSDCRMGVACDRSRLDDALLNLVVNAIHAVGSEGAIRISARLERHDDRNLMCLAVEDDGPGMDEAVKKRLFQGAVTSRPDGHGLGLLGVAEFAKAAGGSVRVESVKGEGCCVTIMLPAWVRQVPA